MTYKIGVDGGGTKTECILVDEKGGIAGRVLAPGCNPSLVGREQAAAILNRALSILLAPASRPAIGATLLCMAGSRLFWREFAAGLAGFGTAIATDDSPPVLELATGGEPGLVLHSGTGSFVAARAAGSGITDTRFAGGLGFRFGDPGSGYDLGRRAAARALLEMQGWSAPSELGALLRQVTGLETADALLAHFYGDPSPNPTIASLAPAVLRLAAAGDPAARTLVVESAAGLLELAEDVAARVFPGVPPASLRAGLSGSILTHPVIAEALIARAAFPLTIVEEPAIEGVRRLLSRIGVPQAASPAVSSTASPLTGSEK